jgi:hypothetical protein
MSPIELFTADGVSTGVWCCGVCKQISITNIRAYWETGKPHTREAAELCCAPRLCATCGNEITDRVFRSTQLCGVCDTAYYVARRAAARADAMTAATLVSAAEYAGPVYCDGVHGDMGDDYHTTLMSLIDTIAYSEIYIKDGELDPDLIPQFAICCTEEHKTLCLDSSIERVCDDGYEEMAERLEIPESLVQAVHEFNSLNAAALTCYVEDRSRKIAVRDLVLDRLNEIRDELRKEREGP